MAKEKKQKFPGQFLGPSYTSRVLRANAERTVNMYLELNQLQTTANHEIGCLIGTPGLTLLANFGSDPIRAVYTTAVGTQVYVVCGNTVWNGTSIANATAIGTMLTSSGPVQVSDNGNNVVFVDGSYGYVTSIVNSLTTTLTAFVSVGITYANGTYYNYPVSGGNGTGMTANITVALGAITSFTLNNPGTGYQVNDLLNVNTLGDSLFTISVATAPKTFVQITNPNFYAADTITSQDGYFIFNKKDSAYFFISGINTTNFLSLNIAMKNGSNDNILSVVVVNRLLYLFGQSTIEVWQDTGINTFTPFTRLDGQFAQIGTVAAQTVQKHFNYITFVGQSPEGGAVVYQWQQGSPVRVSNHALEFYMQTLSKTNDLSTSTAYVWQTEGHYFYVLNLTGADTTWLFDLDTQQWTEQQSTVNGIKGRHLGQCHSYFKNNHLIGDYLTGKLYIYDYNNYTDNGSPIYRMRQAPHVVENLTNQFWHLLQLDISPGVGLITGTTNQTNPTVWLEVSDDGGMTYKSPYPATIGMTGQYLTRARWNGLGMTKDRIVRVTCNDPVPFNIVSCIVDIELGNA